MGRMTTYGDAAAGHPDPDHRRDGVLPEGWEPIGVMRRGRGASAGLRLLRGENGDQAVLKDFSHRGPLFRRTAGALMANREVAAYRRLISVRGIPRLVDRVGVDGILLEYVECFRPQDVPGHVTNEFFEGLREILRALSKRGVIHGDTCRNTRIDSDGTPWLMDFGASFVIRPWLRPITTHVRKIVRQYDDRDVAVLKSRVAPHLLTPSDRKTISTRLPYRGVLAFGRRLIAAVVVRVFDKRAGSRAEVD